MNTVFVASFGRGPGVYASRHKAEQALAKVIFTSGIFNKEFIRLEGDGVVIKDAGVNEVEYIQEFFNNCPWNFYRDKQLSLEENNKECLVELNDLKSKFLRSFQQENYKACLDLWNKSKYLRPYHRIWERKIGINFPHFFPSY